MQLRFPFSFLPTSPQANSTMPEMIHWALIVLAFVAIGARSFADVSIALYSYNPDAPMGLPAGCGGRISRCSALPGGRAKICNYDTALAVARD